MMSDAVKRSRDSVTLAMTMHNALSPVLALGEEETEFVEWDLLDRCISGAHMYRIWSRGFVLRYDKTRVSYIADLTAVVGLVTL